MTTPGMTRRDLLRAGVAAGATLSAETVLAPRPLRAQQPKRGGILRVRGYDPPHFDPHQTLNFKTNTTLSYAAEQQYYVYLYSPTFTASWRPYVKNYAPNPSFDYGNRVAALWLDR